MRPKSPITSDEPNDSLEKKKRRRMNRVEGWKKRTPDREHLCVFLTSQAEKKRRREESRVITGPSVGCLSKKLDQPGTGDILVTRFRTDYAVPRRIGAAAITPRSMETGKRSICGEIGTLVTETAAGQGEKEHQAGMQKSPSAKPAVT